MQNNSFCYLEVIELSISFNSLMRVLRMLFSFGSVEKSFFFQFLESININGLKCLQNYVCSYARLGD